jgi:hypothetical protein
LILILRKILNIIYVSAIFLEHTVELDVIIWDCNYYLFLSNLTRSTLVFNG